jgi:hypothetical protein
MVEVNTSAPQLNQLSTERLIRAKIELLGAVISQAPFGGKAGLQAIRSDNFSVVGVFDEQMVADVIKGVGVKAGLERLIQALVKFEVEHEEPERLSRSNIISILRQTNAISLPPLPLIAGKNPLADSRVSIIIRGLHGNCILLLNCYHA